MIIKDMIICDYNCDVSNGVGAVGTMAIYIYD
jgi:hypothetical protein